MPPIIRDNLGIWIPFWLIAAAFLTMCYFIDIERQDAMKWCKDHGMTYRNSRPPACVDAEGILHQPGK